MVGLRERKKDQTRRQLQEAALTLFVEHGFDNVTTDDIAAAVDVSKTTFYRYFESKEDVLLGNAADRLAFMERALAERPTDEPVLTAVRYAIASVVSDSGESREEKLLKSRVMRSAPSLMARKLEHQCAWEDTVAKFVASRLPADKSRDLRARIIAANVLATMRVAMDYWLATDGRGELADVFDEALATLSHGTEDLVAPLHAKNHRR
ncbi:MAG: TetR family transcriptional regulator [Actinomycetota bacterium]